MKNLKDILIGINEAADVAEFSDLSQLLNRPDMILNKDVAQLNSKVVKRCAGYMVEAAVKTFIEGESEFDGKVYEDGDQWYDFVYDGQKFEIKSFQKGKKFSNTKLTANQLDHKDELIFVLCEYSVNGTSVVINNIELVSGKDMKTTGNRMVKK